MQAARTATRTRTAPLNLARKGAPAQVAKSADQVKAEAEGTTHNAETATLLIGGKFLPVSIETYNEALSALVSDVADGLIEVETLIIWSDEIIPCDAVAVLCDAACVRFFA